MEAEAEAVVTSRKRLSEAVEENFSRNQENLVKSFEKVQSVLNDS